MKYRIVHEIHGHLIKSEFSGALDTNNIVIQANVLGFEFDKFNFNNRQRAELQGQPIFKGLVGPMWDGDAIRYEDERTYALMSR